MEYTNSFVRALDEGGMTWEGASKHGSIDHALEALDKGITGGYARTDIPYQFGH